MTRLYNSGPKRLKNFDYSSCMSYFVTIDVKDFVPFFGKVVNKKVYLSPEGLIARNSWYEIPNAFQNVRLDEFIVMPDHVHGILTIRNRNRAKNEEFIHNDGGFSGNANPMCRLTLGTMIRWYKARCTREIREREPTFSWLPRYYEFIIWNRQQFRNYSNYIRTNPLRY